MGAHTKSTSRVEADDELARLWRVGRAVLRLTRNLLRGGGRGGRVAAGIAILVGMAVIVVVAPFYRDAQIAKVSMRKMRR